MRKSVKVLSILSAGAFFMSALPIYASAAESKGKVRVIVENSTLSTADGANWDGVLMDSFVDIDSDDDALTAFVKALSDNGYTQSGAEFGFVSEINGLGGETGGAWMATLDDWFTDEGLSAYTAESGKLEDGDEIRFMYTMNWGADLGYDWQSTDTSLADIQFSDGTLVPEFDPTVTEYTLELPEDIQTVHIIPTAASKSFRVKMYKNDYTADQLGTDYHKGEEISVSDEDVIIIGIANSAWMSYIPDGVTETVYRIGINHIAEEISVEPSENQESESSENPVSVDIDEWKNIYAAMPNNAIYGNEWGMIHLARFGLMTEEVKAAYTESVKNYLDEIGTAKISNTRSTSVSGVVMALSGMDADVYDFYGYNLLEPLSDMDYVTAQGINGAMYALMALDTNYRYYIPKAADGVNQTTREKLIAAILDAQGSDGGWTFDTGNTSDADMTGIALQALAPYKDYDNVKSAIEKALTFLSENQKDDGGFVSYGAEDSESCSQVIAALAMLHIDIFHDDRFIKNDHTIYDALMNYYRESDNGFAHTANGESNAISTVQAYYAVSTLYQYTQNDMSDIPVIEEPSGEPSKEPSKETSTESDNSVISENSVQSSVPQQQSSTVTENSSNHSNTNTVPTGDTQNMIFIFGAMLTAVSVILVTAKKKHQN